MKKKLEADLISIAHRILKLKNKSELIQLHQESQRLYEKLSVLRFVEENFGDIKPTIGQTEIEEKLEIFFSEEQQVVNNEIEAAHSEIVMPILEEKIENIKPELEVEQQKESIIEEIQNEVEDNETKESDEETKLDENIFTAIKEESLVENVEEELSFKPAFELNLDTSTEKVENKNTAPQIAFGDLLDSSYVDLEFVKPEELKIEPQTIIFGSTEELHSHESKPEIANDLESLTNSVSSNDKSSKGITIGLNDRIGFINHLFGYSTEDYNRVLSQLITIDTLAEAKLFIAEMVKPDYNNWKGKEDYEERFMEIIEKKFS
jgi:hypothetical protein